MRFFIPVFGVIDDILGDGVIGSFIPDDAVIVVSLPYRLCGVYLVQEGEELCEL